MSANSNYEYKKFAILYVDDEPQTAANFKEYFSDTFTIHVATSGEEGWAKFQQDPDSFAVVMTDQRMPQSTGVELLEKVRSLRPRVLRILATAYSDLDAAIQAVNSGAIYKYVTKPWDPPTLEITLKRGMEFFLVQRERDLLLNEKMFAIQRLMMTDRLISLGIFAAGLSHHLRNSLTAVKTFLDLAPTKLKAEHLDIQHLRNPDYWRDFYSTVQQQVTKVVGLLQDIREIPEPPVLPLKDQVDLGQVIKGMVAEKQAAFSAKGLHAVTEIGQASTVTGNLAMLKQAFSLLLDDEVINVTSGGTVSLMVKNDSNAQGKSGVVVTVGDSGPEVPVASLTCIFDPFFVRGNSPAEYGLNLLTVFFLVYHHGGEIKIQSSSAGGAQFEVFIPTHPETGTSNQTEQEFLQRVFATEKVWEKLLLES